MSVRKSHLRLLDPYLVGEAVREDGEWDMHCPLHEDSKRSAQLNVDEGVWYCHAGCGGGKVESLVRQKADWVDPPSSTSGRSRSKARRKTPTEKLSEAKVRGWHDSLMSNESVLDDLVTTRSVWTDTVVAYGIGWDRDLRCYTIPVRDPEGELWNIRRYQLRPPAGRRKIWGVEGYNAPRLYPIAHLAEETIIICEGEWDALITSQYGFPAITRTGAAKVWKTEWAAEFEGKVVYVAHDADDAGLDGNRKVARSLAGIAKEVRVVTLPYPHVEKHGNDLTDFWLDRDGDADAFRRLLEEARPFDDGEPEAVEDTDPNDASVLDSFDSRQVGKPLSLTVTIKGKRDPGYSVPRKVRYTCTRDAGNKCQVCPLYGKKGDDELLIPGSDPTVLEMMDATKQQLATLLRMRYGIPKCPKLRIATSEHQAVEVLFARPSVDHSNGASGGDYKNVKLTSVGRHDTMPNNTVRVVGALHPDPRRQHNEFLAWDVARMETSLDRFEVGAETARLLKRFRPSSRQRPLKKLGEIARDLARHVTRIYGRPELHAAIDLVYHSALGFEFDSKPIRGWLQLLVVGDTRTGKSEVASKLARHYGAGEIISCEASSFAGIVGGLQQYGASKEWAITWGAIPINDRRLVILDEVGGLDQEEIGAMSSVRSSGIAELAKIQQERTHARTRMVWLGNPRDTRMSDYTYGVQAVRPLIGNAEDIARFDLAMSVSTGEVSLDEIHRTADEGELRYTAEACRSLVRWVWSRTPDQVEWEKGAEHVVFEESKRLADRYVEDPPLVQGANVREKVSRVAVALAARLFSTDETYERIVVKREHVEDAVAFLDRLYNLRGFGYAERSKEIIEDRKEAAGKKRYVKKYLRNKPGLAKFLRGSGRFRRQDLEEILDVGRDEANAIISHLWDARMVRKDKGDVRVEPVLHELLREVK